MGIYGGITMGRKRSHRHLFISPANMAACTDLYELTMAAGYFVHGMAQRASFEFVVRRMPKQRSYLVMAGLEQALALLGAIRR